MAKTNKLVETPTATAKLDVASVVQKYKEIKASSSAGFLKIVDGDNIVRLVTFINAVRNAEELYVPFKRHFLPKGGGYVCPSTIGAPCPICEYVKSIRDKNKTLADRLKAKNAFYFFGYTKDYKEAGVLEVGTVVAGEITKIFSNADYGNIADAKTGRFLTITRSGSGLDTEYSVLPKPMVSPLPAKLSKEAIDLQAFLDSKIEDYDVLKKVLADEIDISDVEETEDEEMSEDELKKLSKKELMMMCVKKAKDVYEEACPSKIKSGKATVTEMVNYITSGEGLPF